jgi:hypothetical protein
MSIGKLTLSIAFLLLAILRPISPESGNDKPQSLILMAKWRTSR